jgi:two-component system phosphate regulon response regulator PhoB
MGDGAKRTSSGTRAKTPVVLVAEDDPEFFPLLAELLEDEGFTILSATTGRAALGLARATRPDAILLDLILPDVDGIDVARELKADERTRHIPIIVLTVRNVEESDVADLGLDGVLTKPCDTDVLLERLRAGMERTSKSHIA